MTASPRRRLRAVEESSRNVGGDRESQSTTDMVALVELAKSGDREAFDRLVRITHSDAYALAVRLTGSTEDARDVVQEAYLRAYKSVGRFRGEAMFSTWLYRIVANCATTHLSRRQRHRHDHLGAHDDVIDTRPDHDPVLQGDLADLRENLDAAIRELPARLRSVVVLRDMYDLPHEAIAAELGISVTAAKVRLHRARRRLREQVLPMPGEEPDRDQ
ncbi:MAG: RNA polymerase sigma factor [Acidimicrobiaceae bacterium]|nr:RNA polymerase sigma factor [Acidimicrobiaceae bacterium]MDE0492607.1 RNA polymerase sigma factor [Acidimicrobiaceae bacterium]MDE0515159.1 RNA polymerase sigma factor [Acidimicrobiaceae bacterium]MXZ97176.1 RNA polymerase sigma factor [Acidimicrobiaceae bacterium]MYF44629.1 RNA polymerase sigma factor [Acidimicrobiaceae bacterium]